MADDLREAIARAIDVEALLSGGSDARLIAEARDPMRSPSPVSLGYADAVLALLRERGAIASEYAARAAHFDFCAQMGWPNGQPTWDEMPNTSRLAADTTARETWRSIAAAVLAIPSDTGQG